MKPQTSLGFLHGLKTVPRAFGVLQKAPGLIGWLMIPFVLTLLVDGLLYYFLFGWIDSKIRGWLDLGWLSFLLDIIAAIAIFFVLFWSFTFIFLTLCELVLDYISEAVEEMETGQKGSGPEGIQHTLYGIWLSIVQAVLLTVAELLVLFTGIVPLLGQVVIFSFTVIVLGYAFFSIPAGRKLHELSKRFSATRQHLWAVIGLGIWVFFAGLVPFVNILMLPVFVVAGTLLAVDAEKATSA